MNKALRLLLLSLTLSIGFALLLAACSTSTSSSTDDGPSDGGTDTGSGGTTTEVVTAANAFLATLSDAQQAEVVLTADATNAVAWSNLPCGSSCRNGIEFSTLSDTQLAAAKAVVEAALGTASNEGFDEVLQILAADDVLGAADETGSTGITTLQQPGSPGGGMGGGGYSSGTYYLAFLATPSMTGAWQLQFGGHHLAVNINYSAGSVIGATPEFRGVEPKCWTVTEGTTTANDCTAPGTNGSATTYAPLYQEQTAMVAMLAGLDSDQLASAELSDTFSDVLLGPDQDGQFPATKVGLAVSELDDAQKARVLAAIKPWVQDADSATAAALLSVYENELDDTYIAYSGNASLSNDADYVRIDGPSVWIEFVCQNGVVYSSQIHYHSVWRDHTRDYGGEYSF